ncbi:hypothetical protein CXG81DRAFT_12202 [Caulochytrium protostelioides]|uniref:Translation initiation factor IF2/IF5 domain-containing protein n=1 Tax=Caulochytrium protostelioides TaxID=1555241 RepID=A0A4P9X8A0_9FUNG|nr:hypothetical protein CAUPRSCDRAFT_6182 [Caulochytrium protostelioides]RKP01290.1 hypothetical protein CXG81DRAFT_12202 [Caulochytrium protostelioides]|eukprot:RKP01290.1 hypothetical protein CXG81DRAFT_12202 [Caulochytrium protostelioides]
MEAEPAPANEAAPTVASDAFDPNLLGEKKKKKKKGKADVSLFEALLKDEGGLESTGDAAAEGAEGAESAEGAAEGAFGAASGENADDAWTKSDRDYDYSELLARVFKILRQNNPELAGDKKRYIITPPIVFREGAKRTIFANVVDLCKRMHRQPDHVIQFLFAELGTTGSIDGAQRLVIKGRFQPKQIENVLKRYIVEYVTCKTCKSPDTILTKEARLYFMHCEACGSARTVSTIKTGFMAQTTKRSVARAAAGV